ncbi:hypothetical protein KCP75_00200 [Salmonella enterica subsp. enterica]|nr:hypothetical protein KCP75_00200 [Salmonella enterica subsp. enterica]
MTGESDEYIRFECAPPSFPGFAPGDVRLKWSDGKEWLSSAASPAAAGIRKSWLTWRKVAPIGAKSYSHFAGFAAMATAINQRFIRRTVPIQSAPWRRISSC